MTRPRLNPERPLTNYERVKRHRAKQKAKLAGVMAGVKMLLAEGMNPNPAPGCKIDGTGTPNTSGLSR